MGHAILGFISEYRYGSLKHKIDTDSVSASHPYLGVEMEVDEHMDPASKHAWPTNKTQQKVGIGPLAAGGPSKSVL